MKVRGIPGLCESPVQQVPGPAAERRIAAVLDPEVLAEARGRGHHVAFFAVEVTGAGPVPEITGVAESAFAVDEGSARMSGKMASLSFAFDPARAALPAIKRGLDVKFASMGLKLLPLQVLD